MSETDTWRETVKWAFVKLRYTPAPTEFLPRGRWSCPPLWTRPSIWRKPRCRATPALRPSADYTTPPQSLYPRSPSPERWHTWQTSGQRAWRACAPQRKCSCRRCVWRNWHTCRRSPAPAAPDSGDRSPHRPSSWCHGTGRRCSASARCDCAPGQPGRCRVCLRHTPAHRKRETRDGESGRADQQTFQCEHALHLLHAPAVSLFSSSYSCQVIGLGRRLTNMKTNVYVLVNGLTFHVFTWHGGVHTFIPAALIWDVAALLPDRSSCKTETDKHMSDHLSHVWTMNGQQTASYFKILEEISTRDFRTSDLFLHQILRRQQQWNQIHQLTLELVINIYTQEKCHHSKI